MKTLVPCEHCGRHVRVSDGACPFCGTTLSPDAQRRAVPSTTARLGRAALFAFGTTVVASACAPASPGTDAAADSAAVDAQEQPDSQIVAMYGAPPPVDAGPTDDGSPGARYGGVPAPDAG
ncbi:MAG: hypothetical protein Q8Q09_10600 [Deltaproteobacteria bacterium]|nr:hypothetical protein [Deltaproteobacteria bacterium]